MDEGKSSCLEPRQDEIPRDQHSGKKEAAESLDPFAVGDATIVPFASLRLLGVLLDDTLSFDEHINNVICCCHYQIRRVRQVRRYLSVSAATQRVKTLVLSMIDYCNSVLVGMPENKLNRL